MTVKLLTELHLEFLSVKGGCTGSSESIYVKMPHCWKSHVAAQLFAFYYLALTRCVLGNFMLLAWSADIFSKKIHEQYQFGTRSGPTFAKGYQTTELASIKDCVNHHYLDRASRLVLTN